MDNERLQLRLQRNIIVGSMELIGFESRGQESQSNIRSPHGLLKLAHSYILILAILNIMITTITSRWLELISRP